MFVKAFGWRGLAMGLVLGLGLLATGASAVADDPYNDGGPYQGDQFCALCHKDRLGAELNKYNDYMQHGHRWQEVPTGGQAPGADNFGFAAVTDEHGNPVMGTPNLGRLTKTDASGYMLAPDGVTRILDKSGNPTKDITKAADWPNTQYFSPTWADVRALVGNFKEGFGYLIMKNGALVGTHTVNPPSWNPFTNTNPASPSYSAYTKRCFRCHNPTGFDSTATAGDNRTMYGVDPALWTNALRDSAGTVLASFSCGAPALDPFGKRIQGVQCEHCHGSAGSMQVPSKSICVNCHSSTDPTDPSVDVNAFPNVDANGLATWDSSKRFVFAPTADGKTGVFTSKHPQGDEFRRSPHKNVTLDGEPQGCVLCHDPHKSVWHGKGGVKYVDESAEASTYEENVGNMCKGCHQKDNPQYPNAKKVRIRGVMGQIGLACTDCHMPEKSQGSAVAGVATAPLGEGLTHLFKINPDVVRATDNVSRELAAPWMANWPDAKKTYNNYWKSTDLDGDSFLTCDMVCTTCHSNMTPEQMATYAKSIHRQAGLVDLTVNGEDGFQVVNRSDQVSIDFSIEAGDKSGMKAQIWVMCQGPKGWSSWNGKKWVAGLRAWRKGVALADVPAQNVLKAKLPPGHYTYWIDIEAKDGSEYYDSVPLYVKR